MNRLQILQFKLFEQKNSRNSPMLIQDCWNHDYVSNIYFIFSIFPIFFSSLSTCFKYFFLHFFKYFIQLLFFILNIRWWFQIICWNNLIRIALIYYSNLSLKLYFNLFSSLCYNSIKETIIFINLIFLFSLNSSHSLKFLSYWFEIETYLNPNIGRW